jgi:hypothetical protein
LVLVVLLHTGPPHPHPHPLLHDLQPTGKHTHTCSCTTPMTCPPLAGAPAAHQGPTHPHPHPLTDHLQATCKHTHTCSCTIHDLSSCCSPCTQCVHVHLQVPHDASAAAASVCVTQLPGDAPACWCSSCSPGTPRPTSTSPTARTRTSQGQRATPPSTPTWALSRAGGTTWRAWGMFWCTSSRAHCPGRGCRWDTGGGVRGSGRRRREGGRSR